MPENENPGDVFDLFLMCYDEQANNHKDITSHKIVIEFFKTKSTTTPKFGPGCLRQFERRKPQILCSNFISKRHPGHAILFVREVLSNHFFVFLLSKETCSINNLVVFIV